MSEPTYVVKIGARAARENEAVGRLAEREGEVLQFPDEEAARERADELSDAGDRDVIIQRKPWMLPGPDVDGYIRAK